MAQLDKILKEKLNQFEVDYNPNHWAEMESMLDKNPVNSTPKNWKKYFGYAAGVILITSAVVYFTTEKDHGKDSTSENQSKVEINENITPLEEGNKNEIVAEEGNKNNSSETINNKTEENSKDEITEVLDNTNDKKEETQSEDTKHTPNQGNENRNVSDKVVFSINSNKKSVCQGEKINLSISKKSGPNDATYKWYVNSNFVHTGESYSYQPQELDYQLIKVEAVSGKSTNTSEIQIDVIELPKFELEVINQERTIANPYTTISASNTDLEYQWKLNGETKKGSSLVYEFEKKGNYDIEVIASNKNCKSEKPELLTITINSNLTLAPNSFKPEMGTDEDPGKTFFPRALENYNLQFELIIKDINGNEVYRTNEKTPWNGRLNNTGDMLPVGNYFWILNVTDNNGQNNLYTNVVTLR